MAPLSEDRLDSWKEIAAYLKRGVRTVRRWEYEEGLPVHRQVHRVLGSVYAFKSEIDAWREAGRRSATSRSPGRSIAVLPFANLSPDPENEYFSDGLTDEVTADLSRLGTLRVISRTSSMAFKGTSKNAAVIARELGVRYILEGTVRRSGDALRITARLIDASNDDHLWTEKYDGAVGDVFAFQERLARTIVEALELRLSAEEDRRLADRPISNMHAYECYLRARQEAWRWRKDAIDHAVQLLRNGLTFVGHNARLYAALGHAYLQYREAGLDLGERPIEEADACARKVFEIEPRSAEGLRLRGWIHYSRARIQEAVRDLKSACQIEGSNADTLLLLANCYLISGRVAEARPLIDRVLAIDPLTPVSRCMPAFAEAMEGNFPAAIDPYRQMYEMDPGNPMARLFYVWALIANQRRNEVFEVMTAFPLEIRDTMPGLIACFLADASAGRGREAHERLVGKIGAVAIAADVFPRMLAQGYALAGMEKQALHWLAVAVDRGFVNYPFLSRHDPYFDGLRGCSEFQQLMNTVRVRWEKFEA